jgi:hypothetical protein
MADRAGETVSRACNVDAPQIGGVAGQRRRWRICYCKQPCGPGHAPSRTPPATQGLGGRGNSPRPTTLASLIGVYCSKHCDADHRIASSRKSYKGKCPARLIDWFSDSIRCGEARALLCRPYGRHRREAQRQSRGKGALNAASTSRANALFRSRELARRRGRIAKN